MKKPTHDEQRTIARTEEFMRAFGAALESVAPSPSHHDIKCAFLALLLAAIDVASNEVRVDLSREKLAEIGSDCALLIGEKLATCK